MTKGTGHRRTAALVVGISLGGIVLSVAPAGASVLPPPPPPRTITLGEFNFCGTACTGTNTQKDSELINAIVAHKPQFIALAEICDTQLKAVVSGLSTAGWPMHSAIAVKDPARAACGTDQSFGNAVLSSVTLSNFKQYALGNGGTQVMGCSTAGDDYGTAVCYTHIDGRVPQRGVTRRVLLRE